METEKTGEDERQKRMNEVNEQLLYSYNEMQDEIERSHKSDILLWAWLSFISGVAITLLIFHFAK